MRTTTNAVTHPGEAIPFHLLLQPDVPLSPSEEQMLPADRGEHALSLLWESHPELVPVPDGSTPIFDPAEIDGWPTEADEPAEEYGYEFGQLAA